MAEPFKNLISPATVQHMAQHLGRTTPGFDVERFQTLALHQQAALELKARILRIADGPDEVHRNQIARLELKKHQ